MDTPIKTVIIEDNPIFLENVSILVETSPSIKVVGKYTTGEDGIKGIHDNLPDAALIDLKLPGISGIDVIRVVSDKSPNTELLVLTEWDDDDSLWRAIRAGAGGYILKDEMYRVVSGIEEIVRKDGAPMSSSIARRILKEARESKKKDDPRLSSLTEKQMEVLRCRAHGFDTRKAAELLHISYETVRSRQKEIYRKLKVHDMVGALAVYWGTVKVKEAEDEKGRNSQYTERTKSRG